jgi:hypothetical protein
MATEDPKAGDVYQDLQGSGLTIVNIGISSQTGKKMICYFKCPSSSVLDSPWKSIANMIEKITLPVPLFMVEFDWFCNEEVDLEGDGRRIVRRFEKIKSAPIVVHTETQVTVNGNHRDYH